MRLLLLRLTARVSGHFSVRAGIFCDLQQTEGLKRAVAYTTNGIKISQWVLQNCLHRPMYKAQSGHILYFYKIDTHDTIAMFT